MERSFGTVALAALLGGCAAGVTADIPAYPMYEEAVEIPPGHMPPPGSCRVWFPGGPPGQQPAPGDCGELQRVVPPGAWLLYRPNMDRRVIRIG